MADPHDKPGLKNHICGDGGRKESQREQEYDESRLLKDKPSECDEVDDYCDARRNHRNPLVQTEIVDSQIFMKLKKIVEQEVGLSRGMKKEGIEMHQVSRHCGGRPQQKFLSRPPHTRGEPRGSK